MQIDLTGPTGPQGWYGVFALQTCLVEAYEWSEVKYIRMHASAAHAAECTVSRDDDTEGLLSHAGLAGRTSLHGECMFARVWGSALCIMNVIFSITKILEWSDRSEGLKESVLRRSLEVAKHCLNGWFQLGNRILGEGFPSCMRS